MVFFFAQNNFTSLIATIKPALYKDLIVATYIILFEDFSKHKNNPILEQWLEYDEELNSIKVISVPELLRLTYQVRQESIYQ